MRSKLLIAILVSMPILIILGGVYYFVSKNREPVPPPDQNKQTKSGPKVLVSQMVISPVLSFSGDTIWFMNETGQMFRVGIDNAELEEYLLPQTLENPVEVIWQRQGSDFIIKQNLGGHSRLMFYDADDRAFVPYPEQLIKPAFLPDEQRIVYIWMTGSGQYELKISDADGQNFRKVADLFRPDYELVASPRFDQVVVFVGAANESGKLFLVDLASGGFQELDDEEGLYDRAKFSPDGNKLLVQKNEVWMVYDLNNAPQPSLSLRGGEGELLINETIWSSNSELIFTTPTGFLKYNLDSREEQNLYTFSDQEKFFPTNLIIHPNGQALFFVDGRSGYLFRLNLQ